jgi:hypothetical protein
VKADIAKSAGAGLAIAISIVVNRISGNPKSLYAVVFFVWVWIGWFIFSQVHAYVSKVETKEGTSVAKNEPAPTNPIPPPPAPPISQAEAKPTDPPVVPSSPSPQSAPSPTVILAPSDDSIATYGQKGDNKIIKYGVMPREIPTRDIPLFATDLKASTNPQSGQPVYFVTENTAPDAGKFKKSLAKVFSEAGYSVLPNPGACANGEAVTGLGVWLAGSHDNPLCLSIVAFFQRHHVKAQQYIPSSYSSSNNGADLLTEPPKGLLIVYVGRDEKLSDDDQSP